MPLNTVIRIASTLTISLLVGCSGGDSASPFTSAGTSSCPTTTEAVQAQILAPSCGAVGCHGSTAPALGLDLTAAGVVHRLAGSPANGCGDQTLIVPGAPERSYLITKLTQAEPECGDRMPLGGEPLAASQVECLKAWIKGLGPASAAGAAGQSNATGTGSAGAAQQSAGGSGGASAAPNAGGASSSSVGAPITSGGASSTINSGGTSSANNSGGAAASLGGSAGALNSNGSASGTAASAGASASAGGQLGCGPAVSFSSQVQPIFTANCASAGCHTGTRPAGKLTLAAGASYRALVNATSSCSGRLLVKPSAVSQSYLIDKLLGQALCTGSQMPKAGSSLPSAEISAISGWICEGAPKN